jgi:hypothetical protein
MSFRGGYRIIQTPYKNSSTDFDVTGYSLGLGIKFSRNVAMDFAYDYSSYLDTYQFMSAPGVNPALLDVTNKRFTSSIVVNF